MSRNTPHPNHPTVDQSDRTVPRNLRQTGDADIDLLLSTRVRKSPFWHLSVEEGCRQATVYNHMYHLRAYIDPEAGGLEAEYELLVNDYASFGSTGAGLTDTQRDALLVACDMGYFEEPRAITLSELAAELDISQPAASGLLRRGINRLIISSLMDGHETPE